MLPKGEKVISAHLRHLATQGQQDYLQQAIDVLEESQKQAIGIPASAQSQTDTFTSPVSMPSELQQWPVQLHLLSQEGESIGCCGLYSLFCRGFSYQLASWETPGYRVSETGSWTRNISRKIDYDDR